MLEFRPRQQSAYRSVRYSTVRKNSQTADSQRPYFSRPKGKTAMASTFYQTRTIDLQPESTKSRIEQYRKAPYFETFQSMFQSQLTAKDDSQDFKTNELKVKFINFDDDFAKPEDTQFSLLDPFKRPYSYITLATEKADKQLKRQQQEVKLLKYQFSKLKKDVLDSLKSSQEHGQTVISKLRAALKKNETNQQERKMRVRRELTSLYTDHDHNCEASQGLISRAQLMQRGIFNCQPLQLEIEAQQ